MLRRKLFKEKYVTFSFPIKTEVKPESITYKLRFTDRIRFMNNPLPGLYDNLLHKNECKDYKCCLRFETVKNIKIKNIILIKT